MSEKIATLEFLPHTDVQLAVHPSGLPLIITWTHIFDVSQKGSQNCQRSALAKHQKVTHSTKETCGCCHRDSGQADKSHAGATQSYYEWGKMTAQTKFG